MITFSEWISYREILCEAFVADYKTLYHGSTLENVKNILNLGVQSQATERGVNEFWVTPDLQKAKIFAQVQSEVEDILSPPPLGVFKFDMPIVVLKSFVKEGSMVVMAKGEYEIRSTAFGRLNEFAKNKSIIALKPSELPLVGV